MPNPIGRTPVLFVEAAMLSCSVETAAITKTKSTLLPLALGYLTCRKLYAGDSIALRNALPVHPL